MTDLLNVRNGCVLRMILSGFIFGFIYFSHDCEWIFFINDRKMLGMMSMYFGNDCDGLNLGMFVFFFRNDCD